VEPDAVAAQGWVVVGAESARVVGFGQKFVDEITQDWGGKVMTDLDGRVRRAREAAVCGRDAQGIAGASYGGYAVDWLIGHTTRFKVAVSPRRRLQSRLDGARDRGAVVLEWEGGGAPWTPAAREFVAKWSPHLYAQHIKTPTLVITNELDFRVPVDQGLQLFTALRRNGVPSKALVFPDEGHWVLKPLNSQRWHEKSSPGSRSTFESAVRILAAVSSCRMRHFRRRVLHVRVGRPADGHLRLGADPAPRLVAEMLFSGGIAVAYVLVVRRPRWLPILVLMHILIAMQLTPLAGHAPSRSRGQRSRRACSPTPTASRSRSVVSFVLLSNFVQREGTRYVRAHTEIRLATDIHRLLVPAIARRIGRFEFHASRSRAATSEAT
jgi:dienelactone hydrolase